MIARLVCMFRGHRWVPRRVRWFDGWMENGYTVRWCDRCGLTERS